MNRNHAIDFRVLPGGDVQTTFTQLKALQTLGVADSRSSICFNGITLPAGVFDSFDGYFQTHYAIASKNLSDIESLLPSNIDQAELFMLLNAVARESQNVGVTFTPEEMDAIMDRRSQQMEAVRQK